MQPLSSLTKEDIKDLKLVVFDVDGVTIKKGTNIEEIRTESKTKFTISTFNLSKEMKEKLIELKKHYFVAICSGRSSLYLTDVFNDLLWDNFALISENGIFTFIEGELIQNKKFDKHLLEKIKNIRTDLSKLVGDKPELADFELKQLLLTLHASHELPEVKEILKKNDPEEEFYYVWNGEAFDLAPKILDKGESIKILAKQIGVGIHQTMAIGNGPNDKSMVDVAEIGVSTEPDVLISDFHTQCAQELGGIELVNKLLEISKEKSVTL